ncbi:hypothetical protein KAI87_00770 [Myxococcota bacterium]|nr:hypothetical protein [Myxococcota bacterium]
MRTKIFKNTKETQEPLSKSELTAEQRDDKLLRTGVGIFSGVLLITIVASIHLSTLDLAFGSLAWGSKHLWRGHGAGFRISALNPRTSRLIEGISVKATLRDKKGEKLHIKERGWSSVELNFDVPVDLEDVAALDIEVETEFGTDEFTIGLEAFNTPGKLKGKIVPVDKTLMPKVHLPDSDTLQVRLYPLAHDLVLGLENKVVGQVVEKGKPLAEVRVEEKSIGVSAKTLPSGLFRVQYRPMIRPTPINFMVGESPAIGCPVPIEARPVQLYLDTYPTTFAAPGETVQILLDTLPFRGEIYFDVWAAESLLLTASAETTGSPLELEIVLPKKAAGFFRFSVYRDFIAPSENSQSRLLWVSKDSDEKAAQVASSTLSKLPGHDPIQETIKTASISSQPLLTSLLLSRHRPLTPGLPELISTIASRQKSVTKARNKAREITHRLFAITLILGFLLIVAWILHHQLKIRRAVREVAEESIMAGEEEFEDVDLGQLSKITSLYDLFAVIAALVLGIYSIRILLSIIRWEW